MSPDGGVFAFGDGDEAPATAVTMSNVRSSMVNLEPDSGSSVGLVPINAVVLTEPINSETIVREHLVTWSPAGRNALKRQTLQKRGSGCSEAS